MGINTYRKFEISLRKIIFKKIRSKKIKMNTLMKYVQMVLTNMKQQVMQKSLSTLGIIIHLLIYFQLKIVLWVVVAIS